MRSPSALREHDITLRDGEVVLRPMRETDWDHLLAWNNDPELLYFSDGDDVTSRTLDEVQAIYRGVSQHAFMFIVEVSGEAAGACWLQEMNLPRLLERFPDRDLRRIDIELDKRFWNRGIGARAAALLVELAFEREQANAVFACDIADYNPRSRAMFERLGFALVNEVPQPPGGKAAVNFDLMLTGAACERQR